MDFLLARHTDPMLLTSEVVEPSFFGSVVLDPVQVFLSVVQRVLEAAVTVITVISLSHRSSTQRQKPLQMAFQKDQLKVV